MNKKLTINEKAKQIFWNLGLGEVNYIEIYREDSDKLYFKAGSGRFHLLREELASYQ